MPHGPQAVTREEKSQGEETEIGHDTSLRGLRFLRGTIGSVLEQPFPQNHPHNLVCVALTQEGPGIAFSPKVKDRQ